MSDSDTNDENVTCDLDSDEEFVCNTPKKRKPDFVTLTFPTKLLASVTATVAKANNVSVQAATIILSTVINAGGEILMTVLFLSHWFISKQTQPLLIKLTSKSMT